MTKIVRFKRFSFKFFSWILLSVLFTALSLNQLFGIFGDGLEYIVQTQSFVFDRAISIDTAKRAEYWNQTNPFESSLTAPSLPANSNFQLSEHTQSGGGFGSLYPSKDGKYYYVHSWMYSLVVAPLYFILHGASGLNAVLSVIPPNLEYRSFEIFNSIFLATALTLGVQTLSGALIVLLLIVSPLSGYLSWTAPEIFQFSLLAIAFSNLNSKNKFISPILVGVASGQNFPALIFFLPLALFQIESKESFIALAKGYFIGALVGSIPWLIYYLEFGTPNLIVSLKQASFANCSLTRMLSFLFSPIAGVLWFFPVFLLFLPTLLFSNSHENRYLKLAKISLLFATVTLCFAMTGMVNFHSQQLGCPRYACWIFGPISGILISISLPKIKLAQGSYLFGYVGALLVIAFYHNYLFLNSTHSRTFYLSTVPDPAKKLYRWFSFNEEPEVLIETALKQEIVSPWAFDTRYEIPLGDNQALCLVSLRSFKSGKINFIPQENLCQNLEIPPKQSKMWQRSPVWGGYFLKKIN